MHTLGSELSAARHNPWTKPGSREAILGSAVLACLLSAACNKQKDPPPAKTNQDRAAIPQIPSMGGPGVPQPAVPQKAAGARIEGTIQIGKNVKNPVTLFAGFVGKDAKGQPIGPGTGFTVDTTQGSLSQSASCDTWKPHTAALEFDAEKGWSYKHEGLVPGTYLVYARWGDGHYFDAKWVTVKDASDTAKVPLMIDPDLAGKLEINLPNLSKDTLVAYIPLDDQGKIPLTDVPMVNWYEGKVTAKEQKTVLDNVRAGKYRVTAYPSGGKPLSADVDVAPGKTVAVELKESK